MILIRSLVNPEVPSLLAALVGIELPAEGLLFCRVGVQRR